MTEAIQTQLEIARQARADSDLVTARNGYAQAAALARETGQPLLRAFALRHLSEIDREADRPDSALAHAEQALALYRRHGQEASLDAANALRLMALALEGLRRAPAAAKAWTEARILYVTLGVEAGVEESDVHLAEITD
jgi:tetratricopeptide (TPR) repeat protein